MEEPQPKRPAKKGGKKGGKADADAPVNDSDTVHFAGNNDIVNFGGGIDNMGEEFGEKQMEPNVIHLHYQQRTMRKCLTIIQGLPDDLDYKKLLRAFKKLFNCNGTIIEDPEMGSVIQLQGDQRKDLVLFLTEEGIATRDEIKIHH